MPFIFISFVLAFGIDFGIASEGSSDSATLFALVKFLCPSTPVTFLAVVLLPPPDVLFAIEEDPSVAPLTLLVVCCLRGSVCV